MVTELVVRDDLDGSFPARTVHFEWDGVYYQIDLNEHHESELRSIFEPLIDEARFRYVSDEDRERAIRDQKKAAKEAARKRNRSLPMPGPDFADPGAVRYWAQSQGIPVGPGKPPARIVKAYREAASRNQPEETIG